MNDSSETESQLLYKQSDGRATKKRRRRMLKTKQEFRREDFSLVKRQVSAPDDVEGRRRIVGLGFEDLRDELRSGKIRPVDAVQAYQWMAMLVTEEFNCVTEFVKEATQWAQELEELSDKEKAAMPLYGMPFSVKDNFAMKGYDMSLGLVKNLGEPCPEDSTLVAYLRVLGAVPFVRTNVPQTLLSIACSNPVWGTTLNPLDKKRSPGGSSGGEACLVAAGGSPFGIASDLAGSLRIPASFCGLYTLKPTSGRLKMDHSHPAIPGVALLGLGYGFLAKDLSTLETLFDLTLRDGYFKMSPYTAPIPWNSQFTTPDPEKVRIGFYLHDGWFNSTPACTQALELAKKSLESVGFDLYPFKVPRPYDAYRIGSRCMLPDDGAYLRYEQFKFEPIDQYLLRSYRSLKIPIWLRRTIAFLVHRKYRRLANILYAFNGSLTRMREAQSDALDYRQEFLDAMREQRLDAILCPTLPFPAIPPEFASKVFPAVFGTMLYNLLDFPAGSLPVTEYTLGSDDMADYGSEDVLDQYVKDLMKGESTLPISVQVVTLPYREELCMHIMRKLADDIKK